MTSPWRYDGRRVVVTGAASGMGQAVAKEVAELGGAVTALDVREPTVDVDQYVAVDLSDERSIDAAVDHIDGPLHSVFNCAGISGAFDARTVLRVNFIGMRHLTEALIPKLEGGGSIANVSSTAAVRFQENMETISGLVDTTSFDDASAWCEHNLTTVMTDSYALSKGAVIVYTMRRSFELAPRGVRVNSIGPGVTDTPFLEATKRKIGIDALNAIPKPLGRFARPEEPARALIFLNSDAASYLTGQNVWVDGGFTGAATVGLLDGSPLRAPEPG